MDGLNAQILQCLILDGRAPFRRVAAVVGTSEQTVARRYRAMVEAGQLRVVTGPSGFSPARRSWTVRISCRPGSADALAAALSERDDVRWLALVSGGNEIVCTTDGPVEAAAGGVLSRLPRTGAVLNFTAQALLRPFAGMVDEWTIFDPSLQASQVARMRSSRAVGRPHVAAVTAADEPLLAALARDGRAALTALARDTGWAASRVAARLDALLDGGALFVATDYLPEAFGFHASAIMQLTVAPGRIVPVCRALAEHRETGFVAATTGSANVMALVVCRTPDDLFGYVTSQVGKLAGVTQLDLVPYLRRVKQSGSLVVDGRLVAPLTPGRTA